MRPVVNILSFAAPIFLVRIPLNFLYPPSVIFARRKPLWQAGTALEGPHIMFGAQHSVAVRLVEADGSMTKQLYLAAPKLDISWRPNGLRGRSPGEK